eukprot:scaffold299397_cov18-Tisochrysis_lutea.AAC.1
MRPCARDVFLKPWNQPCACKPSGHKRRRLCSMKTAVHAFCCQSLGGILAGVDEHETDTG